DAAGALGGSLLADALGARVRARLQTPLTLASMRTSPVDAVAFRALPVTLEVDSDALPLGPHLPGVQGDAALSLRARGSLSAPEGEATVKLTGLRRTGSEPLSGLWHLRADGSEVAFSGTLERAVAPLLSLEGRVAAPAGLLLQAPLQQQAPLEAHAVLAPTALASLAALAGQPVAAQGEVSLDVRASGTLAKPQVHAELSLDRLGAAAQALGALRLQADVGPALATVGGTLTAPGGGALTLQLRSARDWSTAALAGKPSPEAIPLDGTAEAKGVDLSFLAGTHPKLRTLSGTLDLFARLHGNAAAPQYQGEVAWKDGRVAWVGYGEYRDVQLKARASHERARLDTFSLSSGGGTLTAQGDALRRPAGWSFTGDVALKRFPLLLDDQLYAYATLEGALKGEWDEAVANFSEVRLPHGVEVELPQARRKDLQELDRPGDVFRTRDGRWLDGLPRKLREAQARAGTQAPPGRLWRASLQVGKGVMVRGMDLVAVLGLTEGFRVEYQDALRLFGEVKLLSGRFEVLGRRFVVQKDSTVQFQGLARAPLVNASAAWTSEREQVTVTMAVRGTGSELQLRPNSQPPLPESDIYTLLATGRRQLKRGSGSSMTGAEAATLVGSALASQLRKTLPGKVPLDVLSVEAGEEGSLSGSRLEAGTYVTDKVYVGYTGRLGANPQRGENGHEVRFEYQVTPQWSLEASFGDAFAGGADLVWTRDY
ncbi:MAG: translocation/assembly module TamB, partial [Deltaproteobacteria bacterium]|nr:translocation/assembly module TamB [Deltaproteobacteria bacterium]